MKIPDLLMLAPFPPPHGGAGKNSSILAAELSQEISIKCLTTSVGILSHERTFSYHLKRSVRFGINLAKLAGSLILGVRIAYVVPDGGWGLAYTTFYAVTTRVLGGKLILHYRNYSYINSPRVMMRVIILVSGKSALHIFLDENMERKFRKAYELRGKAVRLSNAALADVSLEGVPARVGMTVGLISNLCYDKGLYDFIAVVETLARTNHQVEFELAGAPVSKKDEVALNGLLQANPNVRYRGAVHGDRKLHFYRSCDVILFPTRFSQEAQPNVVWEAMACGCAVISFNRGSIGWMLRDTDNVAVAPDRDFADHAATAITNWAGSSALLSAQHASFAKFQRSRDAAVEDYRDLISLIVAAVRR